MNILQINLKSFPKNQKNFRKTGCSFKVASKKEMQQDTFCIWFVEKKLGRNKYESTASINSKLLCKFQDWGDLIRWKGQRKRSRYVQFYFNLSFQRTGENPQNNEQVEGGPEHTNKKIPLCFGGNACEKTFYSV